MSSYYPTTLFPDFDFSLDLDGKSRSAGWYLGAYAPTPVVDTVAPMAPAGLSGNIGQ